MLEHLKQEIETDLNNLSEAQHLERTVKVERYIKALRENIEKNVRKIGREIGYYRLNREAYAAGEQWLIEQGLDFDL